MGNGPEHSAAIIDGKIRLIAYSLWGFPPIGFNFEPVHFEPVQSTFLFDLSLPTDIHDSAPGAVKCRLRLMSSYTTGIGSSARSDSNAKELFEGESTDAYRCLAGLAPQNTPVPIHAYARAESAAGEKAVLFQAYLVDVNTELDSVETDRLLHRDISHTHKSASRFR